MNSKFKIQNSKFFFAGVSSLRRAAFLLLAAHCLLLTAYAQLNSGAQQNVTGKAGTFAIRNARIVTVSGPTIENGTVVIINGKINAVGANITPPSGAEVIDGKGLSVFPGMIDAGTNLGLVEIPQGANSTVDVSELGDMNSNAKAITGINPHTSHVNVTRVNGITTVLSMPSGGIMSGEAAVINLVGSTPGEMAVVPAYGLVLNFPRVTQGGGFGGFGGGGQQVDFNEAIRRRDQRIEELKKILRDAENYARVRDAYNRDRTLPAPKTDLRMEALIPYVRGEKPVIFTVERERDIRAAVRFADEMKLKAVIMGGQEAWKAADVLKQKDVPVVFTNIYSLPVREDDNYDYLYEAPAKLQQAGVRFAISTGDFGGEVRDLPYQAGIASAYGLPAVEALKAVTLYPAQILGVGNQLGSIEVGKTANIVVADGDILEPRTNIRYLFINGRMIPLTSRHTELYEQFKDRK